MKVFRMAAVARAADGAGLRARAPDEFDAGWRRKTPEQKAAEEARDKAYRESLKKIPDAKALVRSVGHCAQRDAAKTRLPILRRPRQSAAKSSSAKASNSKTAASAKPKTKTGTDAN